MIDISPVKKSQRDIDGNKVETSMVEIVSCNILECEVGTNGYQGGDSGHGCRTYLCIKNLSCTDMRPQSHWDNYGHNWLEVVLGGDTEAETFLAALEFAVKELRGKLEGQEDVAPLGKLERFAQYLNALVRLYMETGKLNGMSKVRENCHVAGITKQLFFELGLHNAANKGAHLGDEYCNKVYEFITGHATKIPVWGE